MLNDIKIIITAIIIAVISLAGYYSYNYILEKGKEHAKLECQQQWQKYQTELQQKISDLEITLQQTTAKAERKKQQLNKTISEIKSRLVSEPVVVVENGKCIPATNFLDSINEAISKANQE